MDLFNRVSLLLKLGVFVFAFLVTVGRAGSVYGQTTAERIDSLAVDIWPEYDRAAVLVLFTGFLPADMALPATITVPVPENADVTAVARITDAGDLFADITFDDTVSGQVTLTTPDPRFRVEYYYPYELDGETRRFTFEWDSDVAVTELLVSVQQPVATAELTTEPAAFSVTTRQDGFQYHNLSPIEVPAGDSFSLDVSYSRTATQLSAELAQPAVSNETTSGTVPEAPVDTPFNWQIPLLASLGVAVLAVGGWLIFGERMMAARRGPVKGRPAPAERRARVRALEREIAPLIERDTAVSDTSDPPAYAQFCHHCGQKSDPDDRFCRSCGTRLKSS